MLKPYLSLVVAVLGALSVQAADPPSAPLGYQPYTPPSAEAVAAASTPPQAERFSTLVVYGNDPCPRSNADEIVVCARKPESERYRIPKSLRAKPYNAARDGSWAGTARVLEMVSKQGIPNSCSPTGSYGQTGCFQKFLEENRRP